MFSSPVLRLLGFYCVVFHVAAQVRFICPRPQSALSNITQGACGQNSFQDDRDFTDDFTDVTPGPFTIQWEDTAPSIGRPSRISLGEWGSNKPCVLVDQIPHNDNATVFKQPVCKPNSYPLGSCQTTGTFLTIQIPNINCSRCYLQITSIVTDGKYCVTDDNHPSNCTVYYSCANIRISPSTVAAEGIKSCRNLTKPVNNWPYISTAVYKGNTTGTPLADQIITFTEKPTDSRTSSIVEYVVNFEKVLNPQVSSVSLHFILSSGESAQFFTLTQGELYGKYSGTLQFRIKGELQSALQDSRWFLRLTFLSTSLYPVPYHDLYLIRSGQVYRDLSGIYSYGGWLRGESFVGPSALLTSYVQPAGTCSPEVQTFGSVMFDSTEEAIHGVLTYFVIDNTLFVTGAFASLTSEAWILQLQAIHRPEVKIIFEPQMTGNVLQVSLDITNFIRSAGYPPYKLQAKSKLGLDVLVYRPIEKDRRAVSTPIFDSQGYIMGVSMLTFQETTWTITLMLINPSNQFPLAPDVSLRGPITPGYQGALLHTISGSIFDNGYEIGGWVIKMTYSKTDTIFLQYLWLGMLTLILETGSDSFGGKFQRVTEPFCTDIPYSFVCKVTSLVQAEIPDRRGEVSPSAGFVTFGLNELIETLVYSITVRDLRERERVVDAFFERNGQRVGFISSQGFRTAFWNDRTVVSTGTILLSPELYEGLSKGDIYVGIITERPENGHDGRNSSRTDMQGVLPVFQKFISTTFMPPTSVSPITHPLAVTTAKTDVATCTTLDYARANVFLARVHLCW